MPKYQRKVQVLLTEDQYRDLCEIAAQQKKKIGSLVREAIEDTCLKQAKRNRVAQAVNRLLSMPELPAPESYQEWEAAYLKKKYLCS